MSAPMLTTKAPIMQTWSVTIMSINSRTKGASAEREFSNEVYNWTGIRLVRNLEQSRSGGFDLVVHPDESGAVSDAFRTLAIECKRYAAVTPGKIATWWEQALKQSVPCGLMPVLAYRADRQAWRVIIPLHLVNADLPANFSLDGAAEMGLIAFCNVVREGAL
jgi:hypothetical protein